MEAPQWSSARRTTETRYSRVHLERRGGQARPRTLAAHRLNPCTYRRPASGPRPVFRHGARCPHCVSVLPTRRPPRRQSSANGRPQDATSASDPSDIARCRSTVTLARASRRARAPARSARRQRRVPPPRHAPLHHAAHECNGDCADPGALPRAMRSALPSAHQLPHRPFRPPGTALGSTPIAEIATVALRESRRTQKIQCQGDACFRLLDLQQVRRLRHKVVV